MKDNIDNFFRFSTFYTGCLCDIPIIVDNLNALDDFSMEITGGRQHISPKEVFSIHLHTVYAFAECDNRPVPEYLNIGQGLQCSFQQRIPGEIIRLHIILNGIPVDHKGLDSSNLNQIQQSLLGIDHHRKNMQHIIVGIDHVVSVKNPVAQHTESDFKLPGKHAGKTKLSPLVG